MTGIWTQREADTAAEEALIFAVRYGRTDGALYLLKCGLLGYNWNKTKIEKNSKSLLTVVLFFSTIFSGYIDTKQL